MKYHVVLGENIGLLEQKVNARLSEGWELYGNLIIETSQTSSNVYYQTMVKEQKSSQ
jgi:hypothetical protein